MYSAIKIMDFIGTNLKKANFIGTVVKICVIIYYNKYYPQ